MARTDIKPSVQPQSGVDRSAMLCQFSAISVGRVGNSAARLWAWLLSRADSGGVVSVGRAETGRVLGWSAPTVTKAYRELIDHGFLVVVVDAASHRAAKYQVHAGAVTVMEEPDDT